MRVYSYRLKIYKTNLFFWPKYIYNKLRWHKILNKFLQYAKENDGESDRKIIIIIIIIPILEGQ